MKSLWLKITILLTALLIVSGCGSTKLGNLIVDVVEYHPTTLASQARLTLRLTNENVFPVAIANTTGKLYLNNTYVGKIDGREPVGIPQLSTANREVTLLIENAAFIQQLRSSASTQAIAYRLKSKMRLEVSEERINIDNVSSGQIDAAALRAEPVAAKPVQNPHNHQSE